MANLHSGNKIVKSQKTLKFQTSQGLEKGPTDHVDTE